MIAAYCGDYNVLKRLLACDRPPIDIHARGNEGWTAFTIAASKGHSKCLGALLDAGADATSVDDDGWTALMHASYLGRISVIKTLLTNPRCQPQDVNAQDKWGRTALMYACAEGQGGAVDALLDYAEQSINVNAKSVDGWTALMEASWWGHWEIVDELLAQTFDPPLDVNAVNNDGKSALQLASERARSRREIDPSAPVEASESIFDDCERVVERLLRHPGIDWEILELPAPRPSSAFPGPHPSPRRRRKEGRRHAMSFDYEADSDYYSDPYESEGEHHALQDFHRLSQVGTWDPEERRVQVGEMVKDYGCEHKPPRTGLSWVSSRPMEGAGEEIGDWWSEGTSKMEEILEHLGLSGYYL